MFFPNTKIYSETQFFFFSSDLANARKHKRTHCFDNNKKVLLEYVKVYEFKNKKKEKSVNVVLISFLE